MGEENRRTAPDAASKEEAVRKAIRKVLAHAKADVKADELPHLVRAQVEARVLDDVGGAAALDRLIRELQKERAEGR